MILGQDPEVVVAELLCHFVGPEFEIGLADRIGQVDAEAILQGPIQVHVSPLGVLHPCNRRAVIHKGPESALAGTDGVLQPVRVRLIDKNRIDSYRSVGFPPRQDVDLKLLHGRIVFDPHRDRTRLMALEGREQSCSLIARKQVEERRRIHQ